MRCECENCLHEDAEGGEPKQSPSQRGDDDKVVLYQVLNQENQGRFSFRYCFIRQPHYSKLDKFVLEMHEPLH